MRQQRPHPKPRPWPKRKKPKLYSVHGEAKARARAYHERMAADHRVDRLHLLGVDSYDAYLQSAHWQTLKRLYRKSGRPQCCYACGNETFELHHRTYARLGRERLDDLCPLCRDCHEAAHRLVGVSIADAPEVLKQPSN